MKQLILMMKTNIMYIILFSLIIGVTILLFIQKEEEVIIISRDYSYSVYHSDKQESINIELLTNQKESYHFNKDYIIDLNLHNETEELSVIVDDIFLGKDFLVYQDDEYYQVILKLSIPFTSNDLLIEMENTYLEITYENRETIDIKIGDVVYLFNEKVDHDITLGNLSATHEIINGYNSIGGINLELANTTNSNIMITDIYLLSNNVRVNKDLISTHKNCEFTLSVSSCLGLESYDFNHEYKNIDLSILLGKNNDIDLYIPLIYLDSAKSIYELGLVITYEINNEVKQLIIDDFPFMKTSLFSDFIEEDFHVYKITNID